VPLSAVLLYNPNAGRRGYPTGGAFAGFPSLTLGKKTDSNGDPVWLEAALSHLRVRLGHSVETFACASFDETRSTAAAAAAEKIDVVIVAGGDGTLRAAAEGLAGTDTALGILPRGTVNVLARELFLPLDRIGPALDVCLYGQTRRIDLGRISDRYFLLMCSAGFDARAVHSVRPEVKEVVGAPAYALSAMAALSTFVPPTMNLILDGKPWFPGAAFMVVVANSPAYAGEFRIAPDAEMDDGLLDVILFTAPAAPLPAQRAAFIRQAGAVTLGLAGSDPDVHLIRARQIQIVAEPTTPTQIDGDSLGETPVLVTVAPKALVIRVPS